MIENLIFYGICLFFSLIGLGVIWSKRIEYTNTFRLVALGAPIIIGGLMAAGVNVLAALDIVQLFQYIDGAESMMGGRGRTFLATLVVFGIVIYLTSIESLLLELKAKFLPKQPSKTQQHGG